MKVLLLSGTAGKKSCTRTVLEYIEQLLKDEGIEVSFWDLSQNPLPLAVPEFYMNPEKNPLRMVSEFVKDVRSADGLVLGSPLYHGSYSGILKNALDNLPPDAFMNKAVALTSHSSNARSCVRPCYDLRPIVSSLGGYSIRKQIGTTTEDFVEKDGKLTLTSEKIKKRAEELVQELISLSRTLSQTAPQ